MTSPIRRYRLEKGLTQEGLAAQAELSVRTVQRAEAGSVTPSRETLEAVAEVLEVDPDKLSSVHELPGPVRAALRKIHEGMHDLGEYMYDHPAEIETFGGSHGTYVFQPRDLPPDVHPLICGESLPFHHAHLLEDRAIRREMGEHPDGSDKPWIRRLCAGPTVSVVVDVSPWRPSVWRATGGFTLRDEQWGTSSDLPSRRGTVEQVEVGAGDRIELVAGDGCGPFIYEFGISTKLVRLDGRDVWARFDHRSLPVVPVLDQEREPWSVPRGLE